MKTKRIEDRIITLYRFGSSYKKIASFLNVDFNLVKNTIKKHNGRVRIGSPKIIEKKKVILLGSKKEPYSHNEEDYQTNKQYTYDQVKNELPANKQEKTEFSNPEFIAQIRRRWSKSIRLSEMEAVCKRGR